MEAGPHTAQYSVYPRPLFPAIAQVEGAAHHHEREVQKSAFAGALTVRTVGPEKGKGVFALRSFRAGDELGHVTPFLSYTNADTKRAMVVCGYCRRPLRCRSDEEREWMERLSRDEVCGAFTPAGDSERRCDHCREEAYCSSACKDVAWTTFHRRLCPQQPHAEVSEEQQEALHQLWKEFRGVFGELPLLVGKLIANVLTQLDDGKSPEQAVDSFEHFVVYPREAIKAEDPVAYDQLVRMAHITNRALFDPRIPQLFEESVYLRLAGIVLLNSLGIDFSCPVLNTPTQADAEQIKMMEFDGAVVCPILSSLNHSCQPNVKAQARGDSCRVSLIAKQDVEPNEELCISYVPLSWTRATRQTTLLKNYFFHCQCERCVSEAAEAEDAINM